MRCSFALLLLLSCFCIQAQSTTNLTVRGLVVDSVTHNPLAQATVSLQLTSDSSRTTAQVADGQGRFYFLTNVSGRYWLVVSYVGYGTLRQSVALSKERSIVDMGTLFLKSRPVQLGEVSVQRRQPVRVRNDTLEFDAGSFATRPNSVVEDLIRRLPGMEVASDGGVRAQGKGVQQILVNGQPFFGSDLRMATRNLPADLIDKIQVFDKRSDQSTFSGVDDGSRSRTINVITKPEARRGKFGQQGVGYGTNGHYLIGGGINRFTGERQVSLLGQANNLNQTGYNLPVSSSASGQGSSVGKIKSVGAGLNYTDHLGKRLGLSASYLFGNTITEQEQRLLRQTVLPMQAIYDSSQFALFTNTTNYTTSRLLNHGINVGINYQLDSTNLIRLSIAASSYANNNISGITLQTRNSQPRLINKSILDNRFHSINQLVSPTLLWMHRFRREGRTLSLNNNLSINQLTTNGLNQSITTSYASVAASDTLPSVQDQQTTQRTHSTTDDLTLSYTEPINAHNTIETHYKLFLNQSTSDRTVFDLSPNNPTVEQRNTALSNQSQSAFLSQRLGLGWQRHQTGYRYTLGLDIQQAHLQLTNQTNTSSLSRQYTSLLPYAVFQPQLTQNRYVQVNYQTHVTAPSINQLQSVADVTNPVFIQIGNADLQPEYSHSLNINYNQFQTPTNRSVFAMLTAEVTRHRIVMATSINANGVQTSRPINTNGYLTVTSLLTLGRHLQISSMTGTLNLTTNVNVNRSVNFINNQHNRSLVILAGQNIRLNVTVAKSLEVSLAGTISYQVNSYSLRTQAQNQSLTTMLQTGVSSQLPLGLRLVTDLSVTITAGRSTGYNQQYLLWNSYITYSLFKKQTGELRLQVFDLLNQNRSLMRTVTDTYVEDSQSQVLRRYLLFSFVYNLRQFSPSRLKP